MPRFRLLFPFLFLLVCGPILGEAQSAGTQNSDLRDTKACVTTDAANEVLRLGRNRLP